MQFTKKHSTTSQPLPWILPTIKKCAVILWVKSFGKKCRTLHHIQTFDGWENWKNTVYKRLAKRIKKIQGTFSIQNCIETIKLNVYQLNTFLVPLVHFSKIRIVLVTQWNVNVFCLHNQYLALRLKFVYNRWLPQIPASPIT
jgi:hypothetical protein